MDLQWLQAQQQFHVHQKITMVINRYEVFADDGHGAPGQLVAFVEQKRVSFREQVAVYTDGSRQQVLVSFATSKDPAMVYGYDVVTADGREIGGFGGTSLKSLFRSVWMLDQPGQPPIVVRERNGFLAVFRQVWIHLPMVGISPFPWVYHFDLTRDGAHVGSVTKKTRLRDHYLVRIDDPHLDRRLVIAQAVALDVMEGR